MKQTPCLPGKNEQDDVNSKLDPMKSTTLDLTWEQSRLTEVTVRGASPRPAVRDSLWVSLMTASRSLDSALEDRLMGFPRRPAAWHRPQAGTGTGAVTAASTQQRGWAWHAEDLAYVAIGTSSLVLLVYCFWQMCLSVG